MPCEHYKTALIEVGATGAAAQGELRAHLSECASCRVTLNEEQSLFAAIDSGLHAGANAGVPPSLLPRVRAALGRVTIAPRWSSSWFALVGAAVAAAAFFLAVTKNNPQRTPANLVANRTPAPQILPSSQGASSPALSKERNSVPRTPVATAGNSGQAAELASQKPTPEILVPRDQELLLVSYAQEWGSRKRAPAVAGEVVQTAMVPLEVAPIQITELDVKPLADGDSQ